MPTTFNIKIQGLDKLLANYKKAPDIVQPILQQAIVKSSVALASHTDKSTVPYVSGNLVGSFNPVDIGTLFARWYPRMNYAAAVQFGMPSSPGRFVPAIGKRLKNGKNIGTWPGFAGRHYMEKIKNASVADINIIFANALKEITLALNQ